MTAPTFTAPWSRLLVLMSLFALVVVGAAAVGAFLFMPEERQSERWVIFLLICVALPGALLFIVRGYSITNGKLEIHRFGWKTVFDLADLQSAEFDPDATKGAIRTFGNGGMFSITGWYYSKKLGAFRMFATDLSRCVVLRFQKRRIVVTPAHPDEFVREVLAAAQQKR